MLGLICQLLRQLARLKLRRCFPLHSFHLILQLIIQAASTLDPDVALVYTQYICDSCAVASLALATFFFVLFRFCLLFFVFRL